MIDPAEAQSDVAVGPRGSPRPGRRRAGPGRSIRPSRPRSRSSDLGRVVAVELDDQDRLGRLGDPVAERRQERRGPGWIDRQSKSSQADGSKRQAVDHGRRGVAEPAERQDDDRLRRRDRHGPQRGLGHQRERPLRADDEPGQVDPDSAPPAASRA